MKYWLALFVLFYALQPMQLQACDMEEPQDSAHHAAMAETGDKECCSVDGGDIQHDCTDAVSCGSCTFGFTLLQLDSGTSNLANGFRFTILDESDLALTYFHPPYRPPIA